MSFNGFRENKILAKISESTVIEPGHGLLVPIARSSNDGSGEPVGFMLVNTM